MHPEDQVLEGKVPDPEAETGEGDAKEAVNWKSGKVAEKSVKADEQAEEDDWCSEKG